MARERIDGMRGYWAVLLARGVLAAILALVITFSPNHSPVFGLIVYGAFAFLHGLVLATTAARSSSSQAGAALTLASGVVGLATGVLAAALLFVSTGAAADALVPAIAVSSAATGVLELIFGIRHTDTGPSRDRVVLGVLALVLALAVAAVPGGPVVTVGIVGAYAAVAAVFLIIAALSLLWSDREGTGQPAEAEEEVQDA